MREELTPTGPGDAKPSLTSTMSAPAPRNRTARLAEVSEELQQAGVEPARAPMAVLMERLGQAAPFISVKDPTLTDRIGWLSNEAAAGPAALDQPWFRTRVGYVVQDVERVNGAQLVMDPALRGELDKLALSSPGLRHERLAALMRETANFGPEDGALAQDIRRMARQAVVGSVDVANADGREQVDHLVERTRAARAGVHVSIAPLRR